VHFVPHILKPGYGPGQITTV